MTTTAILGLGNMGKGLAKRLAHFRQRTQQRAGVGAAAGQRAIRRKAQQGAMILDGTGNVDRFAIAVAQVDSAVAAFMVRVAHALLSSRCQALRGVELSPCKKRRRALEGDQ